MNNPNTPEDANTAEIPGNLDAAQMLRLILTDVREIKIKAAAIDVRLTTLEKNVEDRFKDTRPNWQLIDERTQRIEDRLSVMSEDLKVIRRDIGLLREDIWNERGARAELAERVNDIEKERRPN